MPTSDEHRAELAQFLRSRRARISPDEVGLAGGPRRRTAGLRRSEVAFLAGLSTSWYANLERGRDVRPSRTVLDSLARAMRMTEDERRHMHALVHGRENDDGRLTPDATAATMAVQLVRLADHSPYPVYACNRYFDLLAWNPACRLWYGEWDTLPAAELNLLHWLLTSGEARERLIDRLEITRDIVARWRAEASRRIGDGHAEQQTAQLLRISPEFADWWSDHEVLVHRSAVRRFRHGRLGELALRVLPMVSPVLGDNGVDYHLPPVVP